MLLAASSRHTLFPQECHFPPPRSRPKLTMTTPENRTDFDVGHTVTHTLCSSGRARRCHLAHDGRTGSLTAFSSEGTHARVRDRGKQNF